jgi:hypothetical protein
MPDFRLDLEHDSHLLERAIVIGSEITMAEWPSEAERTAVREELVCLEHMLGTLRRQAARMLASLVVKWDDARRGDRFEALRQSNQRGHHIRGARGLCHSTESGCSVQQIPGWPGLRLKYWQASPSSIR